MSLASGNYSIQNVATGRFVGLFFESIGHGAPIIGLPFEDASQVTSFICFHDNDHEIDQTTRLLRGRSPF
jgi:hypothetical protein